VLLLAARAASAGDVVFVVPEAGPAARVAAPVAAAFDLQMLGGSVDPNRLRLAEIDASGKDLAAVPVQFERAVATGSEAKSTGTLWWLMPPGTTGQRRFRLGVADASSAPTLAIAKVEEGKFYDVTESGRPVFRYNFGTVPVPPGLAANYARGDYLHPVFSPQGQVLTDDYTKDHPHHRGISWSWPVTRWKDEVRDIWACVGVWARPVAMRRSEAGPVLAVLGAESLWKWGDKEPLVREEVVLRAFRQTAAGRVVDVEVRLTALVDGVAIGGRPHGGYGGFGLRAAPSQGTKIAAHTDPPSPGLRRSWLDYTGKFGGETAGIAIFEHVGNPLYPSDLHRYPDCNYAMPAFPGDREVLLEKGQPLVLRHRVWIHAGEPSETTLADAWAAYALPVKASAGK
jgi:hypothetical protein